MRKKWGNTGENEDISVKMRKIGRKKMRKIEDFSPLKLRSGEIVYFCEFFATLWLWSEATRDSIVRQVRNAHGCRECPWMPLVESDYVKGALWLYRWLWSKATKDIIVRQLQLYVIDHDLYCVTYFHRMCWTGVYCLFARSVYVFQVDSWPRYILCVWFVLYECVVYWSRYAIHSVIPQLRWLGCLFCIQQ